MTTTAPGLAELRSQNPRPIQGLGSTYLGRSTAETRALALLPVAEPPGPCRCQHRSMRRCGSGWRP
eukprot:8545731-Heterocapsa_arctica.AAC.1